MLLCDLISAGECEEVVRNSGAVAVDFRVVDYRLDKVAGQPGYLGEYAHLTVTIKDIKENSHTQDSRYFVKCLPFSDPKQRKIIQEYGIFAKEADSYRELFSRYSRDPEKVTKWSPHCWLARDDLIVMEDLLLSGYRPMPVRKEFEKTHLLSIIETMAQMHACSLELELNRMNGTKLGDKFGSMLFETTFMRESTWFSAGLKGIVKAATCGSKYALNTNYKRIIKEEMESKMDRIYQLSESTDRFQSVVVHRDMWYNNLMFKFDTNPSNCCPDYSRPTSSVLLDFQIARYLPPAVDFLCAIYLLTRRHHRDLHYETYVQYYYKTLEGKLNNFGLQIECILPWDQFQESLEHYRLVGLLWSGVLLAFVNLPEGYLGELHINDPEAYHAFCLESRDSVIMEFLNKDRFYRDNLLDSVDETLEYLFGFK